MNPSLSGVLCLVLLFPGCTTQRVELPPVITVTPKVVEQQKQAPPKVEDLPKPAPAVAPVPMPSTRAPGVPPVTVTPIRTKPELRREDRGQSLRPAPSRAPAPKSTAEEWEYDPRKKRWIIVE